MAPVFVARIAAPIGELAPLASLLGALATVPRRREQGNDALIMGDLEALRYTLLRRLVGARRRYGMVFGGWSVR